MMSKRKIVSLAALACAAVVGGGVAMAQQLDPGISCLNGTVGAMTFAELGSNYKESIWDSKAAVRLRSDGDELELKVTDIYGTTVCEDTADNRVRCKFNFPSTYEGTFNIRIDNLRTTATSYRLCAE